MFAIKSKRSAGIPVTPAVHRILVRGNAARDRQDWHQAAMAFRDALHAAPELAHIWVQLGNMAKEQGLTGEAEAAYLRAVQLRPGDGEPLIQLGHLFNLGRDHAKAGHYYLRAFQTNPRLIDAATSLHGMIARARGPKRQKLVDALRAAVTSVPAPGEPASVAQAELGPADGQARLVFDVSDLIVYYAHGRLPTGIQRVQIQIITHALRLQNSRIGICCFIDGQDDWREIAAATFLHLVALSLAGGNRTDPDWIIALHQLHLHLALSNEYVFAPGAYLINLGSSWQMHNYFLFVREAKRRHGIRYVPFVHDLIPITAPEYFTKSARREVVPWVLGMFAHADHILVNSEATRRDLLRTGEVIGRPIDPADVAVIRLDAAFGSAPDTRAPEPPPGRALARWQLDEAPFVLFVSTVEARKGHLTALDAWAALIERHGPAAIPKLVCAGKRGWLSDKVYARLADSPALASRVAMLSAVSDAELSLLYRACLFTVYPSLYEGWGLPITEALCHGKPVIASNTSSLPEAGGDFAVYVEPGSASALAAAAERLVFDTEYRDALTARIRTEFRPRSWDDVARQIGTELARMAQCDAMSASRGSAAHPPVPTVRLGAYHSIARGTALRVWPGAGTGEMFRQGTGWTAPDARGSWTRPPGGLLSMRLPPGEAPLRVGLLLLGAADCDVDWSPIARMTSRPGCGCWRRSRWATWTRWMLIEMMRKARSRQTNGGAIERLGNDDLFRSASFVAMLKGSTVFSTKRAHRGRLARANAARDVSSYAEAACRYSEYLADEPNDGPIHVQAGHMFKETKQFDKAEHHYLKAWLLMPLDADLSLQLGHFYKLTDRVYEAMAAYERAVTLAPGWSEPVEELESLRDRVRSIITADGFARGSTTYSASSAVQAFHSEEPPSRRPTMDEVRQSGLFDPSWYRKRYADVAKLGIAPIDHFMSDGMAERREPGPNFEPEWYRETYPDVDQSGLDPFSHYLLVGRMRGHAPAGPPLYTRWVGAFDTLTEDDQTEIDGHIEGAALVSPQLVLAVDEAFRHNIATTVRALRRQRLAPASTLVCLSPNCSDETVMAVRAVVGSDSNFRIVMPGAAIAPVPFEPTTPILLLDAAIELREHAVYMFMAAWSDQTALIYADEDRLEATGQRIDPLFKPDASPELLRQTDYLGACVMIPPSADMARLAAAITGGHETVATIAREAFNRARRDAVCHLPFILFHDHAAPRGKPARRPDPVLADTACPSVTVVVPTRDRVELLSACIDSLWAETDYPTDKLEVVVVDNGSKGQSTAEYLAVSANAHKLRVVSAAMPFNYSRLNNLAVSTSTADVIVLLNNDTVIQDR